MSVWNFIWHSSLLTSSAAFPPPSSDRQHLPLHRASTPDRQFSWLALCQSPAQRVKRTSLRPLNPSADFSRVLLDNPPALSAVSRPQDRHERYWRPPAGTFH